MPILRSMANDMSQAAGRIAVAFACIVTVLTSPSFAHSVGAQPAAQSKTAAPARQAPLAKPLWAELNPEQQLALAPLAADWDRMEGARKKKWIELTKRYSSLSPEQQARMQERMRDWAKLTPDQRRVARESYSRTKRLEPDQKNAQWEEYQQLSDEQKKKLADEAVARKRVTNLPPASPDKTKLVPPSKSVLRPQPVQAPATQ
ncbi:MAG: DUF3106 domain-containing protein [Proteobacteria bacterium]|nr:MAG: DUF3106 domain-containing protein [Pseudomonadota bacterium]